MAVAQYNKGLRKYIGSRPTYDSAFLIYYNVQMWYVNKLKA